MLTCRLFRQTLGQPALLDVALLLALLAAVTGAALVQLGRGHD